MQVDDPVALIDIVPTILDLLGIKRDRSYYQGGSLLHYASSNSSIKNRPIFTSLRARRPTLENKLAAVYYNDWKLIVDFEKNSKKLFLWKSDINEKANIAPQNQKIVEQLNDLIMKFVSE